MIKTLIIILILFSIFFLINSIFYKNKTFYKIHYKTLYTALFFFLIVVLVFFRVINNKDSNGIYTPAKLKDNVIIPGKIEYDK